MPNTKTQTVKQASFGEKLKKLRLARGFTQDELAEKIYVTRTAVSKWETGKGYPQIDSLKEISELFGVSVDELISDFDVSEKRLADEKISRRFYFAAVAALAASTLFTVLYYLFPKVLLLICAYLCAVAFTVLTFYAKPKYRRLRAGKVIIPFVLSRIVILLFVVAFMVITALRLG